MIECLGATLSGLGAGLYSRRQRDVQEAHAMEMARMARQAQAGQLPRFGESNRINFSTMKRAEPVEEPVKDAPLLCDGFDWDKDFKQAHRDQPK